MTTNDATDQQLTPRGFATERAEEGWHAGEAEAILHQLADAFFRGSGAFGGNPEVMSARSNGTRVSRRSAATEGTAREADHPFREDGVLTLDEDGIVVAAGGAALEIFRARAIDELVGKSMIELLGPAADHGAIRRSGVHQARRCDGSLFAMGVTAATLTVPGQNLTLLSLRDVGEAERVAGEQRRADMRYRTLVEQIPAVTFMASLEEGDNEIYIGPQIEALLGFTQKEWLDDPVLWFRQMHPDDQERWNAEFARGCAVGGPFRADCRFFTRDGETVWVHGEARVVRDELGRALFIQGVAFDITDIKQAEQRMREAQDALVRTEKLAAIGQLAASVGHELRNPLAAIRNAWFYLDRKLGGSELKAADARVAQFSSVITAEIERAARIIGELLDFSRERPMYREPCPAPQLAQAAIDVVVKPAPDIRILNEVSDDLPVPNVDTEQFRQVLVNLVQNAGESVDPTTGWVKVRAFEEGKELVFEISDNGKGMTAEVQRRIFEPLFTTKLRGTGLGLAIVDGIVKRHGGSISVKSQIGSGTTFLVRIPTGDASEGPAPDLGGAADLRESKATGADGDREREST